MAREFANTAGSPTQDYIAYSPVAAVAGAGKLSMVIRGGFDSDIPTDAGIFSVTEATTLNAFGFARVGASAAMYLVCRNATPGSIPYFPFTFDGTMRSIVATFDGSASPKVVAYVNGVSQTITGTVAGTTIGSGQTVTGIGRGVGNGCNGRIAEAAIYNRVLTQAEATMHANGMSCLKFPRGLIFYAPLIREAHDIVGGLTGTITGTTVSAHPRVYA